jgi:hypothetical protein
MDLHGLLRGQFYFVYVKDIGTAQETQQTYRPPLPIMWIASLLFYM